MWLVTYYFFFLGIFLRLGMWYHCLFYLIVSILMVSIKEYHLFESNRLTFLLWQWLCSLRSSHRNLNPFIILIKVAVDIIILFLEDFNRHQSLIWSICFLKCLINHPLIVLCCSFSSCQILLLAIITILCSNYLSVLLDLLFLDILSFFRYSSLFIMRILAKPIKTFAWFLLFLFFRLLIWILGWLWKFKSFHN